MYVKQLLADGRDPSDCLWWYPNSTVARKAAESRGEPLESLKI